MDRISHLPEHLLLRVFSFLPTTKDAVAKMVLSKRWQYLWTLVPRLVYDDGNNSNITKESFSRFVDRSLLLHEAPVLEYVRFKLGEKSSDVDNIGVWARTVSRRHVRGDEHVKRFLSNCPLLENLYVDRCLEDNVTVFTVRVPSLKTLYMSNDPSPCWSEPSLVPECLLSSLETLECESYEGTKKEKEVVEYILRNGRCLKKVTISSKPSDPEEKLEMIKELALSFMRSPICQLVFN
ncbi:unnamed protein product [Brassica napus]|uniref:(rape) hypothetical protein n=1 Tax=Brassica napus TaxID=3708 RepID=A0A816VWJ6_BRANA|nr:unnamed protein product [Brassica napus]